MVSLASIIKRLRRDIRTLRVSDYLKHAASTFSSSKCLAEKRMPPSSLPQATSI